MNDIRNENLHQQVRIAYQTQSGYEDDFCDSNISDLKKPLSSNGIG